MTREAFLEYCASALCTEPDYPFEDDFETAVLRHGDNRKWFALIMKVSMRKFGLDSDRTVDIVNLKLPVEMFGSFSKEDGVYPAYHSNKLYWSSVLLSDATDETIAFLTGVSYEATKDLSRGKK